MDLWATLKVLVSRWYVVLPVLLVSLALTYTVVGGLPARYEANASIVVLGPSVGVNTGTGVQATATNPYLQFGGSQDVVAKVLLTLMDSDSLHQSLKDQGVDGSFTLIVTGTSGPIMQLTVTEPTQAAVLRSSAAIITTAQQRLTELQVSAGAPSAQLVRLSVLAAPRTAHAVTKSRTRVALALAAAGMIVSVGAAFAVEGMSRRRRRRRGGRHDGVVTGDGGLREDAPLAGVTDDFALDPQPEPQVPAGAVSEGLTPSGPKQREPLVDAGTTPARRIASGRQGSGRASEG